MKFFGGICTTLRKAFTPSFQNTPYSMLYFLAHEKVTAKIYIVYEGIEDIFPFVLNTKLPMAII